MVSSEDSQDLPAIVCQCSNTMSNGTDESTIKQNRRFLIAVDATLESLQTQEDTDGNMQITIEDNGPKVLSIPALPV